MIRNDHALAFTYTRVVVRFIRTGHAFVASDCRVGTNRPGDGDTFLLSSNRLVFCGDDFSGCSAFLYPALQSCLDAVLGIGARIWDRAEHCRTSTASAMLHSRHHVRPHELMGALTAYFCRDVLVVINGAEQCDIGIAPAQTCLETLSQAC